MPPRHMQNSLGCLCLRVQTRIPSRPERKNVPSIFSQPISGLWPTGPSHAMLAASEYRSQTRRERFFAPGNLSPTRLCWQPTLHRLGVRGCGTARMEGTFFSLGTDSGAMVLHCYLRVCGVEHGCCVRQADCKRELPMGATHLV